MFEVFDRDGTFSVVELVVQDGLPYRIRTEALGRWLPIEGRAYKSSPQGATWRSGYATVCKTVYTSSILVVASINIINDLR